MGNEAKDDPSEEF